MATPPHYFMPCDEGPSLGPAIVAPQVYEQKSVNELESNHRFVANSSLTNS